MKLSFKRTDDLLVDEKKNRPLRSLDCGSVRTGPLREFVEALAVTLTSETAPTMASFIGGKVLQRLERVGNVRMDRPSTGGTPAGLEDAVRRSLAMGASQSRIAMAIGRLANTIAWRRGRSGPFASVHFEKSHAHGVVIGPGGVEDRSDVRIGVTYMEPYSRFPDHVKTVPRAFLLMSSSEISMDGRNWFPASAGTVFASDAGQSFAMRCTAKPLLAVWCHVEESAQ